MFQRRHIIAQAGMRNGTVIIPPCTPLTTVHIVQCGSGFPVITVADIITCGAKIRILFIAGTLPLDRKSVV